MKKPVGPVLFFALIGFARPACAQEAPQAAVERFELYAGYDFLRTNVNSESGGVYTHSTYNLNGGGGQFVVNLNHRLAVVSELAGYALISGKIQPAALSYLAGPRYTLHRGRVMPFAQSLFGGVFSKDGVNNTGYASVFGMALGGGVDLRVTGRVAFRPLQAEYFLMKFPDGADNRQRGFRYSTGVVFHLHHRSPPPA